MAKNMRSRPLALLCLDILLGGGVLLVALLIRPVPEEPWPGRCETAAERAYVIDRLQCLVDRWYDTHLSAWSEAGADSLLILDLRRPAVWVQCGQTVYRHEWVDLPRHVNWMALLQEGADDRPIATPTGFRFARPGERLDTTTSVYLAATWAWGDKSFVRLGTTRAGGGSSRFPGIPDFQPVPGEEGGRSGEVVLVPQDELPPLPTARDGLPVLSPASTADGDPEGWLRVAPRLYAEIERRMRYKGLDLSSLWLRPGPSWRGAKGWAGAAVVNPLARDGKPEAAVQFMVRCLGRGVWYCWAETWTWLPEEVELDFVVTEDGSAPPRGRDWLAEGRALVKGTPVPGPWTAGLSDGTLIEVVGLIEGTGAATRCWEPDGTVIEPSPLFLSPRQPPASWGLPGVVVAKRVWPASAPSFEEWSLASDDSLGSGICELLNEHGFRPSATDGHALSFAGRLETTSLRISNPLRPEAGAVLFGNVSLVPGRHTDCTMTVEPPAAP